MYAVEGSTIPTTMSGLYPNLFIDVLLQCDFSKPSNINWLIVSQKAINKNKNKNNDLLQKAGFLENDNCIPFLAKHQASNRSKTDVELQKIETLDVHLQFHRENKKQREEKLKEKHVGEMKNIEQQTKPLLLELKKEKEKSDRIEECKWMFCGVVTKRYTTRKIYCTCS